MAESAENPLGFEMVKRVKGVEEILEDLERKSSTYKKIIRARIDKRYVDDVWGEACVKMAAHLRGRLICICSS
ncbi:hypothetical protein GCM10009733_107270 [Nonomuraea maheshkhaliensis]|uniref:Uncharacterized protein n=1 Tax=Nonomuraea maheshkhaliensis TaxID=419590 RepID=A0ABP4TUD1_9ACTN